MNSDTNIRPFKEVSPGEILKEEIEERGWTQADFADITGKPVQAVSEIITGKKAITPETAILFSDALGTSPEFWLNLESAYRLDLARKKKDVKSEVQRKARLYALAPVKELMKRGWITRVKAIDELEAEVLKFLGIADSGGTPSVTARFRRSSATFTDSPALISWVRKAEIEALKITCPPYDRSRLKSSLPEIGSLSAMATGPRVAFERLSELGVRVVHVPHLSRTRADGAAFWLDNNSPVIALSLRLDRVDNFWFTLLHEIGHILEGPFTGKGYIDSNIDEEPATKEERKVNAFARDHLIPENALKSFIAGNKPYYSRPEVLAFARHIGVHPGIVVGRLQHEGEIPYTHFRNILEKASTALKQQ